MGMLKRGLTLLRQREFGTLMAVQFAGQAGDGIVQAALAKLIVFGGQQGFDVEGARDPEELLRIVLYIFVPYTVLSPFFGVLIDRWDRRSLLFLANGVRAVVIGAIAVMGTQDVADVTLFLAFLLTLASTRVLLATKASALPDVLEDGSLVEGNAVSQFGGAMFQLGGAGAAIVAASFLDTEPIVLVGAVVYALGAGAAWMLRRAGYVTGATRTFMSEVRRVVATIVAGLRRVAQTPRAAAAISTYFWLRLLWSFTIVGIGFVARDLLADDDTKVLLVTGGAGAAGAVLGFVSANAAHARVRTTGYLVVVASAAAGGATAILGAVQTGASLALLAFFLGFGFFLGKISLDSLVQAALGTDFRGRAFALYDIAYNLAWVVAAAGLKLFYSESRQGALIAGMGVVFLIGLGGLTAWYRRAGLLRPLDTEPEVQHPVPG